MGLAFAVAKSSSPAAHSADDVFKLIQTSVKAFARKAHAGQKRHDGNEYISHPVAVRNLVRDLGGSYAAQLAALVHDVFEVTDHKFGDLEDVFEQVAIDSKIDHRLLLPLKRKVIRTTRLLTHNKRDPYFVYFFILAEDLDANMVKGADAQHNLKHPIPIEAMLAKVMRKNPDLVGRADSGHLESMRQLMESEKQRIGQKFSLTVSAAGLADLVFHSRSYDAAKDLGGFTLQTLWRNWWNESYMENVQGKIDALADEDIISAANRIVGLSTQARAWQLQYEPEVFAHFLDRMAVQADRATNAAMPESIGRSVVDAA